MLARLTGEKDIVIIFLHKKGNLFSWLKEEAMQFVLF